MASNLIAMGDVWGKENSLMICRTRAFYVLGAARQSYEEIEIVWHKPFEASQLLHNQNHNWIPGKAMDILIFLKRRLFGFSVKIRVQALETLSRSLSGCSCRRQEGASAMASVPTPSRSSAPPACLWVLEWHLEWLGWSTDMVRTLGPINIF